MTSRPLRRPSAAPSARAPRRLALLAVAVAAPLALVPSASAAVQDFPVPTPDSGLTDIATGRDGSLWFSEQKGYKVGRITTSGQISEWTIPRDDPDDTDYGPEQLTVAQDGRVWVLSDAHASAFVIDPAVPNVPVGRFAVNGDELGGRRGNDIAAAPDGTVWVTDSLGDGVLRIAPDGRSADTRGGAPECDFDGIVAPGPDGRMWCADSSDGNALKRIELDGVNNVAVPIASGFGVSSLAAGPGGTMWFGRNSAGSYAFKPGDGAVGFVAPDGSAREWPVGDRVAPTSIAAGPDGAMWFGSAGFDQVVGRVTPAGAVTLAPLGVRRADGVAFGGDGALWFIDANANRLTRMTTDEVVKAAPPVTGGGDGTAATGPTVPTGTLRVSKGRIPVRVTCPKTAPARCRGTVRVRTASKVRVGGKGSKALRTVSATGRYTLSPGKTGTIRVKLSSTGKKVIRKGRTTKVSVQVTPTGAKKVAARRTVSLRG
jgi:virginiamycin B lyase